LRTLMQTRGFEELSVQEIADAATVNRATFYDHYTDKFALLDALVAGGFHELLHERKVSYDGSCPSAVGTVIRTACDYMALNHRSCPAEPTAFEPLIEAAVTGAIRHVLMAGIPKTAAVTGPSSERVATTASWAISGAVKEWLRMKDRPSAEEITAVILPMILPILVAHKPAPAPAS
jgi:AcrR family transcriptional regulator